jgi:mycothiol system anti-sigma-R factor
MPDTEPAETTPDCRQALTELFTYLDGEMGADERHQVAQHLDRCSDCLETFEFHHELRALIAQRCRTEAPESLKDRILGAIEGLDDVDADH